MLGHLPVAAARRLGEADDPLGARQRLELVTCEQRVDPLARVERRRRDLDLHRAADVEAAVHEPDLFEHPDEHARIRLVASAGAELLRLDLGAPAEPAVDGAQVGARRDVGAREALQRARVRAAREQERVGGAVVASGPADHLDVALERLGVVVERDEADVRLVDPHPEGGRRDDRLDAALAERLLRGRALRRLEPGVVVGRGEVVRPQRPREFLAREARARVDDRRGTAQVVEAPHERPQPIVLVVDELDVVAQVRPDDGGAHDLGVAAERLGDLALRLGRGGRGHPEDRGPPQALERPPDEEVVGPEVVAPHADAVHLVDHDEADVDLRQGVDEDPLAQTLRGGVEEPVAPVRDPAQPSRRLVRLERGVDQRRLRGDLGRQLVHLVLHQRDQRAEHERRSRPEHRRELVGERLAGARRHQRERVAALDGRADDLLLPRPEGGEAEQAGQRRA